MMQCPPITDSKARSPGARVLDVWMDGRHVQLRQPVITDWASTAKGRGAVTGRVVTPMPGQVTKVLLNPAKPNHL